MVRYLPPRVTGALLVEAVAAVDGAIATGLEGDLGLLAALSADGRMHLPWATAETTAAAAAATIRPAGLPARGATSGLVRIALLLEEVLLARGERERLSTVLAGERLVCKSHR